MELKAIVFDLNGTVLADEDEYGKAFGKVLKSLGARVDSDFPHTRGIGVAENWRVLPNQYQISTDKSVEELVQLTQEAYLNQFEKITLKDGFEDFVIEAREKNIKTALATSNVYSIVDKMFGKFDIEKYFDVITTREEVGQTKPSPEIFLLAADKLFVEPEKCVVFEDAQSGIEAARAADMKVVGIAFDEEQEKVLDEADLVINNFEEIGVDDLLNIK